MSNFRIVDISSDEDEGTKQSIPIRTKPVIMINVLKMSGSSLEATKVSPKTRRSKRAHSVTDRGNLWFETRPHC